MARKNSKKKPKTQVVTKTGKVEKGKTLYLIKEPYGCTYVFNGSTPPHFDGDDDFKRIKAGRHGHELWDFCSGFEKATGIKMADGEIATIRITVLSRTKSEQVTVTTTEENEDDNGDDL